MAIVVTPSPTLFSGYTILGTSDQALQIDNPYKMNVPFYMIINSAFTEDNKTSKLGYSDVADFSVFYPLVDRLNKSITGEEMRRYAGSRRCIKCVFSPIYKVIKVCSCIDPVPLDIPPEEEEK